MAKRIMLVCLCCSFLGPAVSNAEILTYTENVNSPTELALGYPVPIPVDSLTAVDGFRTYQSLFDQHQALMMTNNEMTGQIVGQTHAGRDIWAYAIGDPDNVMVGTGMTEPAVMINGSIHAREWQSPEVVTELIEQLIEGKDDQGMIQFIIDNLNLVVVPVLNVDGFLQTQRFPNQVTPTPSSVMTISSPANFEQPRDGRMRRKNMLGVDESLNTDPDRLLGVDLNRNNAQFFNNGSNSTDPESLVYRGQFPASEPEIQALQQAASLAPENRLRLYIDAHSFGRLFLMPNPNARLANITGTLSTRMRLVTNAFGDPAGAYFPIFNALNTGASTTAAFFVHTYSIPGWTLEIEPPNGFPGVPSGGAFYGGNGVSHDGFVMPDAEIAATRDELTASHLLGLYHQAGPASVLKVQIFEKNTGNVVYDADWVPQSTTTRALVVNQSQTLVAGTAYTIYLAFDKPMRFEDANGNVANYPGISSIGSAPIANITTTAGAAVTLPINFTTTGQWLNVAGGAPSGFIRYKNDAVTADFTMSADSLFGLTPRSASLNVLINDIAAMANDGNPVTVADFGNGRWVGYENAVGNDIDTGGTDSTITLQVRGIKEAPPSGGGGGGVLGGSSLLLLGLWGLQRRRNARSLVS